MKNQEAKQNALSERAPVVVIMGHIDHGKSTLLDYLRNTNIVEKEAGGITQTLSAYEVKHNDEDGVERKITFLDTPGHESFTKMRERGALVADIAILIVSAEDGVKPQTIEAKNTIIESGIPFIVAINKIDKPAANIEKTKIELAENEVYLENFGGKIPVAEISAKTGEGVDNLLSLINIMALMEGFQGDLEKNATGYVIEAHLDPKRGIQATLVIKDGSLKKGMAVAVNDSVCTTNIMENFLGKAINEASFSSPIRLVGWSKMPRIGAEFKGFSNKREAESYAVEAGKNITENEISPESSSQDDKKIIPIILKADAWGSIEAIEKEVNKIKSENAEFRIVQKGAGPVSEFDVKTITTPENVLVIGFNVKADKSAMEIAMQKGINIFTFDVIYKLTEWLEKEMENRRPKIETSEVTGKAKILKVFSKNRDKQIAGGKVVEGRLSMDGEARIMRRDFEIGKGKITNLEKNKTKVREVEEGAEFGMMMESSVEIAPGDVIESINVTQR
ncbi:MAG TPA: translation initiation factor IF-2 [Candidatus Paceibacterota bacterium]|nr:translation initiation factor IF-2 [Candidatus Paceibacterota bacterium]